MKIKINPVLEKEAKIKMRGWKAPALLSTYLLLMGGGAILYFLASNLNSYSAGFDPRTALDLYTLLAMFQLGLLLFITPAIAAPSISGERERQTLDLLLCTRLSAWSIIIGKLTASLSHILLLVVSSIPVFSIILLYGGLSPVDIFMIFLFQIVTTVFMGSVGIFFSSMFKRTTVATIMTYTFVLAITIATLIGYAFYGTITHALFGRSPSSWEAIVLLCPNPFIGLGAILDKQTGYFGFVRSLFNMSGGAFVTNLPWILNIAFDMVMSAILLWLSAWRIKPVKGR